MGIALNTDIVPFVIHNVLFKDHDFSFDETDPSATDLEKLLLGEHRDADYKVIPIDIRGWVYMGEVNHGKRQNIYGDCWMKNGETVVTLNTSEYESVGEKDMCVCSITKEALEHFLSDFASDTKHFTYQTIEETDVVHQYS